MSLNSKIKIGLVGAGHMGQYHVNVASDIEEYDLKGIYDADTNRAKEIAERMKIESFPTYNDLLEAINVIVISTPTALHYEFALKALNAGKHVLVEKPMVKTIAQAEELVTKAEEKGLIFQVGHVERFNGAVLELGKIVKKPYLIESRRLAPFNNRIQDVGVVLDLMIHDLDIVLNLVDSDFKSVYSQGQAHVSKHEDIALATIQFESGCLANFVASRVTQNKIRRLNITQEEAYIVLDFATQDIDIHRRSSSAYLMTREELKYKQEAFVERIEVHRDNPLRQEHLHFISCTKGLQEPIVTGKDELRTLKIATTILDNIAKTK